MTLDVCDLETWDIVLPRFNTMSLHLVHDITVAVSAENVLCSAHDLCSGKTQPE